MQFGLRRLCEHEVLYPLCTSSPILCSFMYTLLICFPCHSAYSAPYRRLVFFVHFARFAYLVPLHLLCSYLPILIHLSRSDEVNEVSSEMNEMSGDVAEVFGEVAEVCCEVAEVLVRDGRNVQ